MVCHRRAGKTVAICNDAIRRAVTHPRQTPPPRFAWFYPTRVRAKDIAWQYLKYYSSPIPGVRVMESELSIELPNKSRVTLYGADNARGVGLYLDGCYYDECDEIPKSTISDVAPALADYSGFTVYAGMLKGRYNLWKRYEAMRSLPGVFSLLLRASESGIIGTGELERLKATMGLAAYDMQLECNPNAAIANAIYGAQMDALRRDNRIGRLSIDLTSPLYAFADIGHSMKGDDWSWWIIQLVGRDILVHEYFANTGEMPSHYAGRLLDIEQKAKTRLTAVYLPHDGDRMDRHGRSAKDDLEEAGLYGRVKVVPRTPHIWDSINDVRALMPRMYLNQDKCSKSWMLGEMEMPSGIDCLDFYTKKIETKTALVTEVPVHDQYSHGADAMRTFSEAYSKRMLEGTSEFARAGRLNQITVTRVPMDQQQTQRNLRITVTR